MKFKATKKEMRDNYSKIIGLGYCSLQSLLSHKKPIAYSCGVNGWSCDYYVVDDVLISTGYSPLSHKGLTNIPTYEERERLERLADVIRYDYGKSYEERTKILDQLLLDFVHNCIN